ncbi:uncharacterized protein LOC131681453 isoform X4 [Topomyia yanbarensis]|uniref:uncharacterized protein LOC131681453 isoform X4 n=1 Tax=Topomyia yanbarensis TaxID=2498891 RepID=UPI00273AC875|nr:uncharacterized protein LOC131681453 isoform X4 [Topomyia yanbarensis]
MVQSNERQNLNSRKSAGFVSSFKSLFGEGKNPPQSNVRNIPYTKAPIADPEASEPTSLVSFTEENNNINNGGGNRPPDAISIPHDANRYEIRKLPKRKSLKTTAATHVGKPVRRKSFGRRINNLWNNFGLLRSSEKIAEFATGYAAYQHVRDNLEDLDGKTEANETDLVFLQGILENPAVTQMIKPETSSGTMNYGRKTPSTYRSTPSVYSHITGRSQSNLHSQRSKSLKSLRIPWYQKPILHNNKYMDIQRGAIITGTFSIFVALFTIFTAIFDIYCLVMAAPGSTHYGYYIISYEFVYVGNKHVRNGLMIAALFSLIGGLVTFVTSIMLVHALRKEHENRVVPWLWTFAVFTIFRFLALLLFSIVNDLIFAYNILITLIWILIILASVYGWVMVYSLYLELADLTKLEDLAHLRMGTMQSLNASVAHSLAGSRPTTPHSTVSTMPVGGVV